MAPKHRSAFTLVELTVVSMIIAALLVLILPAVQAVRESARRAQCSNNLMQLGLGIGCYVSTHSVLPPGGVNESRPIKNVPFGYHHSWVVQILPFVGEGNLYNHFDITKSVYDAANDTVVVTRISTLLCPSCAARNGLTNNFAGCHHDVDAAIDTVNSGVLYLNSRVRYDEIVDGPAYTILLGEIMHDAPTLGWASSTRSTLRNTGPPLNAGNPPVAKWPKYNGESPRHEILEAIEDFADDDSWPIELTGGFSSYHSSSCNFVFCDGSVRAVKQSVNTRVYRLLGNRADGEPISSDAY